MAVSTRQSGIGLLEAVIGTGFAAALQDGLSRSAPGRTQQSRTSPPTRTAPSLPTAPGPPGPLGSPGEPTTGEPAGLLSPAEAAAVLRRFELALPLALDADDAHSPSPASWSLLISRARRILALACGGQPDSRPPGFPATRSPEPPEHWHALVSTLLVECAVLHVLETDAADLDRALLHAAAVVPQLGRAIRREESLATAAVTAAVTQPAGPDGDFRSDPPLPPLPPLRDAVRALAAQAAPAGVTVAVTTTGKEWTLAEPCRRALLRAVRECLFHSCERGQPAAVTVSVRVTRWWAHARIEGEGIGLDAAANRWSAHRDRRAAELISELGGRLAVTSRADGGTRIDIHLPLRPPG